MPGRSAGLERRDPTGAGPLFYLEGGLTSVSLRDLVSPRPSPDPVGIYLSVAVGAPVAPWTCVEHILQAGAGERVTMEKGRLVRRRYWDLDAPSAAAPADAETVPDVVADRLRASIARQVAPYSRPFVALSGGAASSLLAALLAEVAPGRAAAITVGPRGVYDREAVRARRVANALKLPLITVDPSDDEIRSIPRSLAALHHPVPLHEAILSHLVARAAARDGRDVGLWGLGADFVVGLPARHRVLLRVARLRRLAGERLPDTLGRALACFTRQRRRLDLHLGRGPLSAKYQAFFIGSPAEMALARLFRREVVEKARAAMDRPEWAGALDAAGPADVVRRALRADALFTLGPAYQRAARDVGAAHRVAAHLPFLDAADLPTYAAIPASIRRRDRRSRWLLDEAAARRLTREVVGRSLGTSTFPLERWFGASIDDDLARLAREGALLPLLLEPKNLPHGLAVHPRPAFLRAQLVLLEAWWRLLIRAADPRDSLDGMLGLRLGVGRQIRR